MDQTEVVVGWLKDARRVVYPCGAGLSVPSGIRAYRSGTNAVWGEYVLEWGTRSKFLADPAAWWKTFWLGAHGEVLSIDNPTTTMEELFLEIVRESEARPGMRTSASAQASNK